MIEIKDLNFYYNENKPLFEKLDLKLQPGNIYGLLGKNGVGKTTLLKLIAGLLFPKKGTCKVFGKEAEARSPTMLSDIFFIAEDFHLPEISIAMYVKIYAPFYPKFDPALFKQNIEKFELTFAQNLAHISYGQKKKFLLAFGVATNARLLLLDEPTNGLDIPSKSQFRQLLASAITDDRIFVIATHQVRDMENLIDPIIIVDQGEIIFNSNLARVAQNFLFTTTSDEAEIKSALYAEKTLNGYAVILPNVTAEESLINLEFLFNAVIFSPEKIKIKEEL